jgi:hypothetical protein
MANVYTTVSNAVWYTDQCEIVTGNSAVTYNIYRVNVAQPITFGGFVVSGNANINTVLYTQANIVGASVSAANGIAANTTVSSVAVYNVTGAITEITLNNAATANVGNATATAQYVLTLPAPGNLYANSSPQVAANNRQQIYVGAGNYLTITGSNFTARELGTASSATAGF